MIRSEAGRGLSVSMPALEGLGSRRDGVASAPQNFARGNWSAGKASDALRFSR
ncbi:hypothetical protein RLPCCGM1_c4292 [Rhizobium leguminosarum bv. phaseoli CCGM1]|nr:hypothetical protein RLPCCGM1_c4292 [Rhizobium leguminosarum bv. phaseoli CCGM1]